MAFDRQGGDYVKAEKDKGRSQEVTSALCSCFFYSRRQYARNGGDCRLLVFVKDFRIDLCRGEFSVSEQLAYGIDVGADVKHKGGECVPCAMESDRLRKEKRTGEDKT